MGLPVSTYLGYKILQPENDISSGKDIFCSLFPSFLFHLLLFYIWIFATSMKYITGVSQIVEYEKTVRQSINTCRTRLAMKYRIPVGVHDI